MWQGKREKRRRLSARSLFKFSVLALFTIAGYIFFGSFPNILLPPTLQLTKYVNPFIGTGGSGHTYPGATVPFGMVQLSPDNGEAGWEYSSGYHYNASTITGFSHTHLSGTGIGDLLDISLQPTTRPVNSTMLKEFWDLDLRQNFSHAREMAEPGYYKVFLDHGVQVELTATERTGMHRYTFYPTPKTTTAETFLKNNDMSVFERQNSASSSEFLPGIVLNLCFSINADTLVASMVELNTTTTQTTLITGYRKSNGWAEDHQVYYAMEFSVPISTVALIENGEDVEIHIDGNGMKTGRVKSKYSTAYFTFDATTNNNDNNEFVVLVKVGLSSVSIDGALENLRVENPTWDFDAVRTAASAAWEDELRKIEVNGGSEESKTVFYTSLYHTKFAPTLHSDRNGAYRGPDSKVHRILSSLNRTDANYYSTLSIWDTFRAAHPLLTILNSEGVVKDVLHTILAHADHLDGLLPFWPLAGVETKTMPGYHAAVMLTEGANKNLLTKQEMKRAFKAMKFTAMDIERGGFLMDRYGFVPADKKDESVTTTLELAYDDYCLAQMAEILNKPKAAAYFYNRSRAYQRVFDHETQFMRAKFSNNSWKTPFNPRESRHEEGDYTEGNAWQHLWFVPHDIPGLIKLFSRESPNDYALSEGGEHHELQAVKNFFEAKLDQLFSEESLIEGSLASVDISGLIGQYAHGNEPSHHVAYLYNYLEYGNGQGPHKTQARVRQILNEMYSNNPDGLAGNEDCGQMSAWYVFSALGFYPVNPVESKYQLGSPLFDYAEIDVGKGKKFEVKAAGAGTRGDVFVKKVRLNGQILKRWYITHDEIMNGGVLELEMSSEI